MYFIFAGEVRIVWFLSLFREILQNVYRLSFFFEANFFSNKLYEIEPDFSFYFMCRLMSTRGLMTFGAPLARPQYSSRDASGSLGKTTNTFLCI